MDNKHTNIPIEGKIVKEAKHIDEGYQESVWIEFTDGTSLMTNIEREYNAKMEVTLYTKDKTLVAILNSNPIEAA